MSDLRLYRLAFLPTLVALVVLAFSLQGEPSAVEPPSGTLDFDTEGAASATREVLALGESREPGSETDEAVADLVADRFGSVVAGTVSEQTVDATIDGEETELRNVILTLPGASDRAIVVMAARDSRAGEGAPSSAAATGVLLELVNELSVANRNRTLILASTSGASAGAEGARALIEGLPERTQVDAAIVISQPGYDEPFGPHVVVAGGLNGPPVGLAQTAQEILSDRGNLSADRPSAAAQIARYAIPAAAGEQAALIEDGVEAVALSAAGELPLPPEESGRDHLAPATLERIGPALLALVAALDASPEPPAEGPGRFIWVGDNLIPGWSVGLLVLALLIPPAALAASVLARARRGGGGVRRALTWALEWWVPTLAFCLGVYALSIVGVISGSGVPYDPDRFDPKASEVIALVLLGGFGAWLWWILHLRRLPSPPGPVTLGAAAGLLAVFACAVVWLANPYLALVLVPLVHVTAVLGAAGRRPAALAAPALILASVPLVATLVYVGSALDWGASAPVQLAALMAGGGIGPVQAIGAAFVLASVAAVTAAALATVRTSPSSLADPGKPGGGSSEAA